MGLINKAGYGMFVSCGIWCLADVSSVSPSPEQTLYVILQLRYCITPEKHFLVNATHKTCVLACTVVSFSSSCNGSFLVQSEAYVALEATKAAEKSVLDEQVRTSQEALQAKLGELSSLQQQHVRVREETTKMFG